MNDTRKLVLVPIEKYERLIGKKEDLDEQATPIDLDLIVNVLPKMYRNKARTLLTYIQRSDLLDWTDKGELVYEKKIIPHSHISDLTKHAMRMYVNFNPVGVEEFYSGLAKINIPQGILGNEELKRDVEQMKSSESREWISL